MELKQANKEKAKLIKEKKHDNYLLNRRNKKKLTNLCKAPRLFNYNGLLTSSTFLMSILRRILNQLLCFPREKVERSSINQKHAATLIA